MASQRETLLAPMSLDALADFMSNASPGAGLDQAARAEFTRRQTAMQREATDAAIAAASAAQETAQFTRDNARYMLLSVIVLALSSVATLIVSFAGFFRH